MPSDAEAAGFGLATGGAPVRLREQMHGARYGEVLLVTGRLPRLEATVYNTLGLNDCPDDLWQALDPEAIKQAHHAKAAILNGPRYFLMDKVAIVERGGEIVQFGGLRMRPLATVRLPASAMLGGRNRESYKERTVDRTTAYVYDQGREVYELVAPDGTTYAMQSYSLAIDPTLTEADLPALGERLQLPKGWRYQTRRLADEWVLRVDGKARVVQDDLENTYQRV